MSKNKVIPFSFKKVSLNESVWVNKSPYFSAKAIAEWLGYSDYRDVLKLVSRNPVINEFSVVVKLPTTDGKAYNTTVFDPIGLQLILMRSNAPKALEYQIFVAHLVQAYMSGKLKKCNPDYVPITGKVLKATKALLPYKDVSGHAVASAVRRAANKFDISIPTLYRYMKDLRKKGEVTHRYSEGIERRKKKFCWPLYIKIVRCLANGFTHKQISDEFKTSESTIRRATKEIPFEFALSSLSDRYVSA